MIIGTNILINLALAIVIGTVLPLGLVIVWKLKTKEPIKPVLVGALVFFIFALVLESIPKMILLQPTNPLGTIICSNVIVYSLIGAFLAGLFEETGRLIAFKTVLKNNTGKRTSITYGIGHGGFEAMFILVAMGAQYLIYAIMINSKTFDQVVEQVRAQAPSSVEAIEQLPSTIAAFTTGLLLLTVIERIFAVIFHIALSIIVFKGVREKKWYLYVIAVLLHMGLDIFAALYQTGVLTNIYLVEALVGAFVIVVALITFNKVYKKLET